MATEGIDVSHHQGVIDWRQVAGAGVRFAFIKATEGYSFRDRRYDVNAREAREVGIDTGAYHYARPDLHPNTAHREAENLAELHDAAPDLAPILDLEEGSGDLTDWTLTFLRRFHQLTGRRPGIYVSPAFADAHLRQVAELTTYPLWIAHWQTDAPRVPRPWRTYAWWQYTSRGRVAGIAGPVDRNRAGTPPPPPPPPDGGGQHQHARLADTLARAHAHLGTAVAEVQRAARGIKDVERRLREPHG